MSEICAQYPSMKCPVCKDAQLVMTERQMIEIDYCPNCRGVWLDRGELDKIIERSLENAAPIQSPAQERARPDSRDEYRQNDEYGRYKKEHHHKKRKSLLGELFDF